MKSLSLAPTLAVLLMGCVMRQVQILCSMQHAKCAVAVTCLDHIL